MKKLTYAEFVKRTTEVAKANRIFGNLTENNISTSFAIYQEILAEEQMEVFISTASGDAPLTPMDDFERPKCPECQSELRLKLGAKDQDGKEWNSSWVCTQCLAEFYSEKTAQEWMNELKRRDAQEL